MNVGRFLDRASHELSRAGISGGRLDCMVLIEDAIGKDRSRIIANSDHELTVEQKELLQKQIARRARHEPLAYIRGKSEFYGRMFSVSAHTLQPRPESETMIDVLLKLWKPDI